MPRVVSFVGAKGGTLKTSGVAAIADVAAGAGLHVVMVDGDPQADLTSRSGFERVEAPLSAAAVTVERPGDGAGSVRLLRGGRTMEGADLAAAERHLATAAAMGADLVLVDTPPALGPVTTAAIRASDLVLVPAVPGKESLEHIHDVIRIARAYANPPVRVVITLAHRRSNLIHWMQGEVDALYPGVRLGHVVPFEVAAGEAALYEKPVTRYAPRSHNAVAFRALTQDLLRLLQLDPQGQVGEPATRHVPRSDSSTVPRDRTRDLLRLLDSDGLERTGGVP